MVKAFFKALRMALGPFMLLWEYLTRPRGIKRPLELQQRIDRECQDLALYQFRTCPFCIKVRQEMRRLSLQVRCLDAQHDGVHRDELLRGGGAVKVPCLCITSPSGEFQWLYESGKVIEYLRERFQQEEFVAKV